MGRPSWEDMLAGEPGAPPTGNQIQERQAVALESIATSLQQLVKVLNTKKK
jgi:hypothetical protein